MKLTKRLLALTLALVMAMSLAACGSKDTGNSAAPGGESSTPSGESAVYRTLYSSEVETMNYLVTTSNNNLSIPANVVDTLIEYDSYGVVQPSLAESWEHNGDYTEWTFHIRQGVKWVDKDGNEVAEVKAKDWVDAAYYILDANHDSGNEYNFEVAQVTNAAAYYEYTAYLLALETATDGTDDAGNPVKLDEDGDVIDEVPAVTTDEIGVTAPDDYTLVYTLDSPCSYFLSMLCWAAFMPVNGDFLAETGDSFGTSAETLLYCGPFILSDFQPQVQRVMSKNASYWDVDHVYLDAIQETYNAEAFRSFSRIGKCGSAIIRPICPKRTDVRADLSKRTGARKALPCGRRSFICLHCPDMHLQSALSRIHVFYPRCPAVTLSMLLITCYASCLYNPGFSLSILVSAAILTIRFASDKLSVLVPPLYSACVPGVRPSIRSFKPENPSRSRAINRFRRESSSPFSISLIPETGQSSAVSNPRQRYTRATAKFSFKNNSTAVRTRKSATSCVFGNASNSSA